MSALVVDELITTLSQTITFKAYRKYIIEAITPKLLMYNAPSGTFTLSVKDGATTLASKSFTSADIKTDLSTASNYAWLWKVLNFTENVALKAKTYTLELSSSGYTYNSSSWLGWVKDHESIFNDREDAFVTAHENPLSFRIYEKQRPELVR